MRDREKQRKGKILESCTYMEEGRLLQKDEQMNEKDKVTEYMNENE